MNGELIWISEGELDRRVMDKFCEKCKCKICDFPVVIWNNNILCDKCAVRFFKRKHFRYVCSNICI